MQIPDSRKVIIQCPCCKESFELSRNQKYKASIDYKDAIWQFIEDHARNTPRGIKVEFTIKNKENFFGRLYYRLRGGKREGWKKVYYDEESVEKFEKILAKKSKTLGLHLKILNLFKKK